MSVRAGGGGCSHRNKKTGFLSVVPLAYSISDPPLGISLDCPYPANELRRMIERFSQGSEGFQRNDVTQIPKGMMIKRFSQGSEGSQRNDVAQIPKGMMFTKPGNDCLPVGEDVGPM